MKKTAKGLVCILLAGMLSLGFSGCFDCDDDDDDDGAALVVTVPLGCVCGADCYDRCDVCDSCGSGCYEECNRCCE